MAVSGSPGPTLVLPGPPHGGRILISIVPPPDGCVSPINERKRDPNNTVRRRPPAIRSPTHHHEAEVIHRQFLNELGLELAPGKGYWELPVTRLQHLGELVLNIIEMTPEFKAKLLQKSKLISSLGLRNQRRVKHNCGNLFAAAYCGEDSQSWDYVHSSPTFSNRPHGRGPATLALGGHV
ncbi:hypothetical protein SARC_00317 [Sphaeroforma arctica JP610]|uniref:Uncharacterized protein n=1 Tax=Sphaeroforma arctica JP610 TaxID=667725 RepID=A0A0L0GEW9_9EUKA|nr:hypothetical protein SARC_00317 [Sphaeroforma arctica JP610]KNC87552.1 hypothetical protein SARC_00317 [Sphaeroforma arctica JP610]|eukprot:XP_014161454.1 hypothetical protein SARC_00317 [Sphaeroforma arctica JP610]